MHVMSRLHNEATLLGWHNKDGISRSVGVAEKPIEVKEETASIVTCWSKWNGGITATYRP